MKYDAKIHCGAVDAFKKSTGSVVRRSCTVRKGMGTDHPGIGYCVTHDRNAGHYDHVNRNRLAEITERTRRIGVDPSDITGELELVRALLIAYIEDHTDLDDSESLTMTGDMIDRVVRVAQAFRKMRQEEMLHIAAVRLLEMEMANVMMKQIDEINPELVAEWRTVLVERIKQGWGNISVITNVRELKKLTEDGSGEDNDG